MRLVRVSCLRVPGSYIRLFEGAISWYLLAWLRVRRTIADVITTPPRDLDLEVGAGGGLPCGADVGNVELMFC